MKTTVIPGTAINCSRFIFGTANILRAGNVRQRANLLAAAVDHGFTHFDTAPYYGFGIAERDLRGILKSNPHLGVTTKVGLYPPGGRDQPRAIVIARKAAGRLIPMLSRPAISFDLARARRSLDDSLRHLGRDCIDIYLLHEPRVNLLDAEKWQTWMDAEIAAGRVRAFGIAVATDHTESFLRRAGRFAALTQLSDSLDGREADTLVRHGRPLQITYGYVSAARRCGDPSPARYILEQAQKRNESGAIVVSTTRIERVAQYHALTEAGR